MNSVISEASGIHFDRRIRLIKDLINYWKNDAEVAIFRQYYYYNYVQN